MPRRQPLPQRRLRPLRGTPGGAADIHQQLLLRGYGPRWRRISRPATINDGEIVADGTRFTDDTLAWWPDIANLGEDDNNIAFLDYDSDGDADFLIASLTGPDRLLINDGAALFSVATQVFDGPQTPGTLSLVLADLDGDHRLDVVMGQGENPDAVTEHIFLGTGLEPDTAPPVIERPEISRSDAGVEVRARIHDRKTPPAPHDWQSVEIRWRADGSPEAVR